MKKVGCLSTFGLRTLLAAVAILSGTLASVGWQWQIVRERQGVAAWIQQRTGPAQFREFGGVVYYGAWPSTSVRRPLGDQIAAWVYVDGPITEAERQRVARAFPEAKQFLYVTEPAPNRPTH